MTALPGILDAMFEIVLVAVLTVAVLAVVLGAIYRESLPEPPRAGPTDPFAADFPRRWRGYDPVAVERRLAALRLAWADHPSRAEHVLVPDRPSRTEQVTPVDRGMPADDETDAETGPPAGEEAR